MFYAEGCEMLPFQDDPSPYEQHMAQILETNRLKTQIRQYGDETMRVGAEAPVGANVPTQTFERSYYLHPGPRGPKHRKDSKPDPCKRLMKVIKLKPQQAGKTGKKNGTDNVSEEETQPSWLTRAVR